MPRGACAPRAQAYRASDRSAPCLNAAVCQDLRSAEPGAHNPPYGATSRRIAQALPLRPQDEVECRRCGVHCDKVVYPAACIDRACPFVYAYEEFGHTYIGCMQKVYEVEIDVDLLREAEARRGGLRRRPLDAAAAADVPRRGRGDLPPPGRRARLREPGVLRAAGRRADVPRLRPGSLTRRSQPLGPSGQAATRLRAGPRVTRGRGARGASHLAGVRAVVVRARHLQHRGQPLERRVAEEDAELLADQALAAMFAWRSRFEPSGAFASLTCSARSAVEADPRRRARRAAVELRPRSVTS